MAQRTPKWWGGKSKGKRALGPQREGRERLSFRLELDHSDWDRTSLQPQHCLDACSKRHQSSLPLLLDQLAPSELLQLCTDVGSGSLSSPSHFDFSAAAHVLEEEHLCEFARAQSCRQV